MTKRWTALVLASLLGTVAGCGGDEKEEKPTKASCNVASLSFCMDIDGILPTDATDCTSSGGVWSTSAACPTTNLVGTCTVSNPSANQTIAVRFYTPVWDDTLGASACTELGGTYTP
jgi:hypothetical protein